MSDPLDGVRLKLQRVHDQLHYLKSELDTFFEGKPYTIATKFDPDTLDVFAVADERQAVPPIWSVLIGEIAHNLRSALDHLVWQLVIKETDAPPSGTQSQFPIFLERAGYESNRGEALRLVGVGAIARALIKAAQPFATGEEKASPLWHLHELSNWDKHKRIALTGVLRKAISIEGTFTYGINDAEYIFVTPEGPLKHGTVLGGVRFKPSPAPFIDRINEVKMKGKLSMNVAFEEPVIMAGLQMIDGLKAIHNRVVGIIVQFEEQIF